MEKQWKEYEQWQQLRLQVNKKLKQDKVDEYKNIIDETKALNKHDNVKGIWKVIDRLSSKKYKSTMPSIKNSEGVDL